MSDSQSCAPTCPNAWEFECLRPGDCATGVCCYDPQYPMSYCTPAASCTNYRLCKDSADCTGAKCLTVSCAKPTVAFRVCEGGGPGGYKDYPGVIPSCTLP